MERNFKIRVLLNGKFEGKPISLTKEMGHYCVEYINEEGEARWWNPCEEDEIVVRNLYWQIVKNGKKLSKSKRSDMFFLELGWIMRVWDYDI